MTHSGQIDPVHRNRNAVFDHKRGVGGCEIVGNCHVVGQEVARIVSNRSRAGIKGIGKRKLLGNPAGCLSQRIIDENARIVNLAESAVLVAAQVILLFN